MSKENEVYSPEQPSKISICKLIEPDETDIHELSMRYPYWDRQEIVQLFFFNQVRTKLDEEYCWVQCAECPKLAKIPFRLFVDLCFRNYYVICESCRERTTMQEDDKLKNEIGMPRGYQGHYLNNWKKIFPYQEGMYHAATQFLAAYPKLYGLLLSGSAGTGKTRLMCTIVNELLIKHGESLKVRIVDFPTLAARGRKDTERKEFEKCQLLCIDELTKAGIGMEFGTYIYPIIATRHAHGLPTIITTNMALTADWLGSDNEYCQRLGDRFKDFLRRETFGEKSMRG